MSTLNGSSSDSDYSFNMAAVNGNPNQQRKGIISHSVYKPSTIDEEVLYTARIVGNSMELAKWDGHQRPLEIYTISNKGKGKCNCQGSSRQPYCKHRKMVDKWEQLTATNPPFVGEVFDFDHEVLYTPADGEGYALFNP